MCPNAHQHVAPPHVLPCQLLCLFMYCVLVGSTPPQTPIPLLLHFPHLLCQTDRHPPLPPLFPHPTPLHFNLLFFRCKQRNSHNAPQQIHKNTNANTQKIQIQMQIHTKYTSHTTAFQFALLQVKTTTQFTQHTTN